MTIKTDRAGMIAVAAAFVAFSAAAVAQTPPRAPATPQRPATAPSPTAPAGTPPAAAQRPAEPVVKRDEVIARVGTTDITAEEVRAVIAALDPRQQAALARDPSLLSQTVRGLLANQLVLKEALSKKWEQQPAIATQIARARDNLISETYLQSVATPPDNFPSEAEIKAVYDANASAFLVPRKFQVAQIFVAVAKDADSAAEEAARKRLDDVMKKLKQPRADFAAIAKSDSDDQANADRGGEIGWLAEAEMRAEIRSPVVGLAQFAVTEPIRLDDGWHILKLLETRASHTAPLSDVRASLVQRIRAERVESLRRTYVAELLRQNPPVINELALMKLLADAPSR